MGVSLANEHYLSEGPNALRGGWYVNAREEGCQRGFTEFQRIGKIHQIEEGWEMEGIEDVECLSRSN